MLRPNAFFSRRMGAVLTCLALTMPVAAHSQAPPARITQDEAITRAKEFCTAIGESANWDAKVSVHLDPTDSPASTTAPTSLPRLKTYWQPCYLLSLQDGVEIAVDASTGIIAKYQGIHLVDKIVTAKTPPDPPMSEQKAISLAAAAVKATGQKDELVFLIAQPYNVNDQDASQQRWIVRWRRAIHGIPYHDQHASFMVQATTGALVIGALKYTTPPYTGDLAHLPVSQSKAVKAATDYCVANSISLPFEAAHLEIVQPNNSLVGVKPSTEADVSSHAAWICSYTDKETFVSVWVDARTGALLGGETVQIIHPIIVPLSGNH